MPSAKRPSGYSEREPEVLAATFEIVHGHSGLEARACEAGANQSLAIIRQVGRLVMLCSLVIERPAGLKILRWMGAPVGVTSWPRNFPMGSGACNGPGAWSQAASAPTPPSLQFHAN